MAPDRLLAWCHDGTRALARFEGHTKSIGAVAPRADGRLVSSSTDGTLRLWPLPPA